MSRGPLKTTKKNLERPEETTITTYQIPEPRTAFRKTGGPTGEERNQLSEETLEAIRT